MDRETLVQRMKRRADEIRKLEEVLQSTTRQLEEVKKNFRETEKVVAALGPQVLAFVARETASSHTSPPDTPGSPAALPAFKRDDSLVEAPPAKFTEPRKPAPSIEHNGLNLATSVERSGKGEQKTSDNFSSTSDPQGGGNNGGEQKTPSDTRPKSQIKEGGDTGSRTSGTHNIKIFAMPDYFSGNVGSRPLTLPALTLPENPEKVVLKATEFAMVAFNSYKRQRLESLRGNDNNMSYLAIRDYERARNYVKKELGLTPEAADILLMLNLRSNDDTFLNGVEADMILYDQKKFIPKAIKVKQNLENQISMDEELTTHFAAFLLNVSSKVQNVTLSTIMYQNALNIVAQVTKNVPASWINYIDLKALESNLPKFLGIAGAAGASLIPPLFDYFNKYVEYGNSILWSVLLLSMATVAAFEQKNIKNAWTTLKEYVHPTSENSREETNEKLMRGYHWFTTNLLSSIAVNCTVMHVAGGLQNYASWWIVLPATLQICYRHIGIYAWNFLWGKVGIRETEKHVIVQERIKTLKAKLANVTDNDTTGKMFIKSVTDSDTGAAAQAVQELQELREVQLSNRDKRQETWIEFSRDCLGLGKRNVPQNLSCLRAILEISASYIFGTVTMWWTVGVNGESRSVMVNTEGVMLFDSGEKYPLAELMTVVNDKDNVEMQTVLARVAESQRNSMPQWLQTSLLGRTVFILDLAKSAMQTTGRKLGIVGSMVSAKFMAVLNNPEKIAQFVNKAVENKTGSNMFEGMFIAFVDRVDYLRQAPVVVPLTKAEADTLLEIAATSLDVRALHLPDINIMNFNEKITGGDEPIRIKFERFVEQADQDLFSCREVARETEEKAQRYKVELSESVVMEFDFYDESPYTKSTGLFWWQWEYMSWKEYLMGKFNAISKKAAEWVQKYNRFEKIANAYQSADTNYPMREITSEEIQAVESDWSFVGDFRQKVWKMLEEKAAQNPNLTALFHSANMLVMTVKKTFTISAIGSLAKVYYEAQLQKIDAAIGTPGYHFAKNNLDNKMRKNARELEQWYTFDADNKLTVKDILNGRWTKRDWREEANIALGGSGQPVLKPIGTFVVADPHTTPLQRPMRVDYASAATNLIKVKYEVEECEEEK